MFKRCDRPNDIVRGGGVDYCKSNLAIMFKPEFTKLTETLVFQVKIGTNTDYYLVVHGTNTDYYLVVRCTKKCFITCIDGIPQLIITLQTRSKNLQVN